MVFNVSLNEDVESAPRNDGVFPIAYSAEMEFECYWGKG
jgi:hypothetical protein